MSINSDDMGKAYLREKRRFKIYSFFGTYISFP